MVGTEGSQCTSSSKIMHQEQTELRPKIEIVRVPSIERASFRPLDGVQIRATYSHVRVGTYCPEPEPPENQILLTPCKSQVGRPPTNELYKKHKKFGQFHFYIYYLCIPFLYLLFNFFSFFRTVVVKKIF